MNDIRRTILWVIFGFSMVLLWDQWQVYNGHKATFLPSSTKTVTTGNAPVAASSVPVPVPATNTVAGNAQSSGAATPISSMTNGPAAPRERLVVATDVLKVTFDTEGGSLVQTEFVKHASMADKTQKFVLLDDSKDRTYLAQTGLIGGAAGGAFPTHKTVMAVAPGETPSRTAAKNLSSVSSRPNWEASSS